MVGGVGGHAAARCHTPCPQQLQQPLQRQARCQCRALLLPLAQQWGLVQYRWHALQLALARAQQRQQQQAQPPAVP